MTTTQSTLRPRSVDLEPMLEELAHSARQPPDDRPDAIVDILVRHGMSARFVEARGDAGLRYTDDWRAVLEALVRIGGADLNAARLLEGHLNALQLIALYGDGEQQTRVLELVRAGGMMGVWGAEASVPVRLAPEAEGGGRLSGAKRYASGLGALDMALVPITDEEGTFHLLLLRVDDPARADASSWNHRGMRRTASGTFDFEGMRVDARDRVGKPGDYRREPFFVGGIWRCAAAQLGAVEAITAHMARELSASGRDGSPLQRARLSSAIIKARTARLWIEDAARRVETSPPDASADDINRTVALSAFSRLVTEEAAMAVIDLAERALGLGSFAIGHPVEALTRDLAVYIRQANPDAVMMEHGRVLAKDLVG